MTEEEKELVITILTNYLLTEVKQKKLSYKEGKKIELIIDKLSKE